MYRQVINTKVSSRMYFLTARYRLHEATYIWLIHKSFRAAVIVHILYVYVVALQITFLKVTELDKVI